MTAAARAGALALALLATPGAMDAQLLSTAEGIALPARPADHRIAWGNGPVQFGDLRLPDGPGPHPVVVLMHGGCWLSQYSLEYMGGLGDALKAAGIATWSIEYRRIGDNGGGWPGTFQDAGAAIDHLRTLTDRFRLDLSRVVLAGHSAGGHLALWAAARGRLPAASPVRGERPLAVRGVVGIAPIGDLAASLGGDTPLCGGSAARLMGGTPGEVAERYAQGSPSALLPLGVPLVLVVGSDDRLVPAAHVAAFADAARKAGDSVRLEIVPASGHFEPIAAGRVAFAIVVGAIRDLARE